MSGICSEARIGQECSFNCTAGFFLEGTSNVICQMSREEDVNDSKVRRKGREEVCQMVWCNSWMCQNEVPSPLSLSQSPLVGVGSSLKGSCHPGLAGETCFLQCPSGHRNSKRTNLVCQIDGSWDEMSCIPIKPSREENPQDVVTKKPGVKVKPGVRKSIHCLNVIAPFGGKTSGQCRPGIPGSWCKVFCPTGYQVIWCKSTGSWFKNGLKWKSKSIYISCNQKVFLERFRSFLSRRNILFRSHFHSSFSTGNSFDFFTRNNPRDDLKLWDHYLWLVSNDDQWSGSWIDAFS